MDELVFAVPASELWNLLAYKEKGLIHGDSDALKMIVKKGLFLKRNESEEDPSNKQIISYAVISNKGPERIQSFYLFKRTSGLTEKRLQNKFSLGVGGHMNPGDLTEPDDQYLINELMRELFEEVRLLNGCFIEEMKFIGFINDDTIPVGRVHIGLLWNICLSSKDVQVCETGKMTASWINRSRLAEFYEEMETWTKIIFDYYIK